MKLLPIYPDAINNFKETTAAAIKKQSEEFINEVINMSPDELKTRIVMLLLKRYQANIKIVHGELTIFLFTVINERYHPYKHTPFSIQEMINREFDDMYMKHYPRIDVVLDAVEKYAINHKHTTPERISNIQLAKHELMLKISL